MASNVSAEQAKVAQAEKELKQLEGAYADLATDVGLAGAGWAPPPWGTAADVVSLGRSLWKGDWGGALFDAIGLIPVAGDAAKAGKIGKKLEALETAIKAAKIALARSSKLAEIKKAAAAKYWNDIRTNGRKAYDEAIKSCNNQACRDEKRKLLGDHYKNTPKGDDPTKGTWKNGARGDGKWTPAPNSNLGKNLEAFSKNQKLNPSGKMHDGITYTNGHPDYSDFVVPAGKGKGQVEIIQTGDNTLDFKAADEALMKATGKDKDVLEKELGTKLTWHHMEDGVTMQLLPTNVHGAASQSGHAGGASMVKTPEF